MLVTEKRSFPKPINADWSGARAAYADATASLGSIAQRFGIKLDTLKKRALREGWQRTPVTSLADEIERTVHQAVHRTVTHHLPAVLRDQQEDWKQRELRAATKLVDTVERRELDKAPARDVSSLASALDSASRVGRRALDLDTEQQLTAFSAGLCTGSRLQRAQEKEASVIDVSTNPPADTQA